MLSVSEFFNSCSGLWQTDRTYHTLTEGEIERSYTQFRVEPLTSVEKQQILSPTESMPVRLNLDDIELDNEMLPGFSIAFDTVSEKGEKVSMRLKALFVPDTYVLSAGDAINWQALPIAAQVFEGETIQGYYLRNEGYSEAGAIAGRFTYQPTRQTLEMTTYYKRSVAVDQMRFIAPDLRLRTIVTYKRDPDSVLPPTEITLIGFGVERRQPLPIT